MARIHTAARRGRYDEVAALLSEGADPNAVSPRGETPLMIAVREAYHDLTRLLLKSGANPNIRSRSGSTALHAAAGQGMIRLVAELLDAGADPNVSDQFSHTPMISAAMHLQHDTVALLRARGADASPRSREGMTADEWLEIGGLQGHCDSLFPEAKQWRDPDQLASGRDEEAVRRMMAECADPDEYAARHGRNILCWSYGFDRFRDPEMEQWTNRVWEIVRNQKLLYEVEDRLLKDEALAEAQKRRTKLDRFIQQNEARKARIAACRTTEP